MEKTTNYVGLREKTFTLQMMIVKTKKATGTKRFVTRRKLKFKNYKNFLEATQLENRINHLEKNKIDIESLKNDHK